MVSVADKIRLIFEGMIASDGTLDYTGDPTKNRFLVGESEWGEFYLPPPRRELKRDPETPWKRRFNPFNPFHWPYYLGSAKRQRVVWLEQGW